MNRGVYCLVVFVSIVLGAASAFVSPTQTFLSTQQRTVGFKAFETLKPAALQRQRKSMTSVQTMGLFGLGAPEIAVILVAAAFLLGPQKLAEFGKDAGKIAGELKEVPKEFQKGMAEGEMEAKKAISAESGEAKDVEVQDESKE